MVGAKNGVKHDMVRRLAIRVNALWSAHPARDHGRDAGATIRFLWLRPQGDQRGGSNKRDQNKRQLTSPASRDKEFFTFFRRGWSKSTVENCGNKCFMARSL